MNSGSSTMSREGHYQAKVPVKKNLELIAVWRAHLRAENGAIENEFQWLFILELPKNFDFSLQQSEVAKVEWKSIATFKTEVESTPDAYVPHGPLYYGTVWRAIKLAQAA